VGQILHIIGWGATGTANGTTIRQQGFAMITNIGPGDFGEFPGTMLNGSVASSLGSGDSGGPARWASPRISTREAVVGVNSRTFAVWTPIGVANPATGLASNAAWINAVLSSGGSRHNTTSGRTEPPAAGWDGEGADSQDNCPRRWNPAQDDGDADGIGDACEAPLRVANVSANGPPLINLIYSSSGVVPVQDSSDGFPLTAFNGGTGSGQVLSRTMVGERGAPAHGFRGYEYRVDMRNAVAVAGVPCIQTLKLNFDGLVPFDFDGDGQLDDLYVITSGDIGTVGVQSAGRDADGSAVAITFAGAGVCATQASFTVGMLAGTPPLLQGATVASSLITANVQVRAPEGCRHQHRPPRPCF
jgi:hypothetical protein